MQGNLEKFTEIIRKFSTKKVIVVGDIMLDEYVFSKATRLSPEAPVPIIKVEKTNCVLGGAANVANNLKSLGAEVTLVGVVGKDQNAKQVVRLLKERNISTRGIIVSPKRQTSSKKRIISQGQHIIRVDTEDQNWIDGLLEKRLVTFVNKEIKDIDAIIISDYAKGVITSSLSQDIIQIASKKGKLIVVDPKGKDFEKYRGCQIITPNLKELEEGLGISIGDLESLPKVLKNLKAIVNSQGIVAKLGSHGMSLLEKSGEYFVIPAIKSDAVDVSGAGDTAVATLTLSLASEMDLRESMILSNIACGVVVAKFGTATVSAQELKEAINHQSCVTDKIMEAHEITRLVINLKKEGKKVIMTGGVFDILHPGHSRYLQKARSLGDVLIVAVNSDESVRRNKGPKRPINKQQDRLEILAALSCVDYLVLFTELTPEKIISKVKPDIWVKGGDYNRLKMPETRVVERYGGVVKILPIEGNYSDSKLIEKIIKEYLDKTLQKGDFAL